LPNASNCGLKATFATLAQWRDQAIFYSAVLADNLIGRTTEHAFQLAIGEYDISKRIHYDDADGIDRDHTFQYGLWLQHRTYVACKHWRYCFAYVHILPVLPPSKVDSKAGSKCGRGRSLREFCGF
jgi:hypothetical protein